MEQGAVRLGVISIRCPVNLVMLVLELLGRSRMYMHFDGILTSEERGRRCL